MAATPILTRPSRAAAPRRWIRAQALALALLLLVTQQWGLAHWLQHRSAGGGAPQLAVASVAQLAAEEGSGRLTAVAADGATGSAADGASDGAADTVCATCLALAALGTAALPQWPAWAAQALPQPAPTAGALPALRVAAASPFQARAPPVLS